MVVILKDNPYKNGFKHDHTSEFIMDSPTDLANLPEDAQPGSTAYTADLKHVWQKAPDGTWVAIIGGDNP